MWFKMLRVDIKAAVKMWLKEYESNWMKYLEMEPSNRNVRNAVRTYLDYYEGGKYSGNISAS